MQPSQSSTKGWAVAIVLAAAGLMSCTTFIQPTTCERGSTKCGGSHDARFCEYVASAVEGAACDGVGLVQGKHFCVVTNQACLDTNYAVKDQDCKVVRYELVRDRMSANCPVDAPMFVNR